MGTQRVKLDLCPFVGSDSKLEEGGPRGSGSDRRQVVLRASGEIEKGRVPRAVARLPPQGDSCCCLCGSYFTR